METQQQIAPSAPAIRDNSGRAKRIITIFWILLCIDIIAIVSGYLELNLLKKIDSDAYYTMDEIDMSDLRQALVGLLQLIVFIGTAILFIQWFRRAYYNAHTLSTRKLEYHDSWAVWGFIVPIISLFYPYRIASEINHTHDRYLRLNKPNYALKPQEWIIGLWWGLYLITNVLGNIAMRSIFKDDTLADLIRSSQAYLVSDSADIIAILSAIYLVMMVSEKERQVYEQVRKGKNNTLFL